MAMRVAFILNSAGLYGANRSLLGLIRYLREKDIVCFAMIPTSGGIEEELRELNVEYVIQEYRPCVWYPGYIGVPFLVNLIKLPTMIRIFKKWNVDLIHTNNSNFDIGMILAKILHKKHVWHVREIMERFYYTRNIFPRLYRKLRAQSNAVICVSQFVYDYHMERYPNCNMKMIYNPYDTDYYNISREDFAANKIVKILMAGLFTENKRQIDAVKAIKVLLERGVKNVKLILAGNGDQKCIDEIVDYIQINHLEQWIEMLGFVSDLRGLRNESDITLCCSTDEALPRVVVEGMLGELLTIGADSGGVTELLGNRRGLLYEFGNYEQLADQIEYAIDHKKECREIIMTAKKYAIDNFELNHSGDKVLEVYHELLGQRS